MVSNRIASLHARPLNKAKEQNIPFSAMLVNYGIEGVLNRLKLLNLDERYILKGAIALKYQCDSRRTTKDIDFLGHCPNELSFHETNLKALASLALDDGLQFKLETLEVTPIQLEKTYQGVRAKMTATLGNARIPIQIDVGFGDEVDRIASIHIPGLIDRPAFALQGYPLEFIFAEKLEAIFSRGTQNSRLKDFMDCFYLSRLPIDDHLLGSAIEMTFQHRGTVVFPKPWLFFCDPFVKERASLFQVQWKKLRAPGETAPTFSSAVAEIEKRVSPFLGVG